MTDIQRELDEVERLRYWLVRLYLRGQDGGNVLDVLANRGLCPTNNRGAVRDLLRRWDAEPNRVRYQFDPPSLTDDQVAALKDLAP